MNNKKAKAKIDPMAHYFEFLDFLLETGRTNMYGASPHLMEAFELPRKESREILKMWMDQYGKN